MTLASEGVAKIIVCDVAPDERRRFDRTQRRWGAVAHCAGLVGQCGGWSREERARAVIFAYWNNRDFYDAFMKAEHDAVAVRQRGAYESAAIALSSDIVPIADDDPPRLSTTLRTATFARVADCHVKANRVETFVQAQHRVWNPGMATTAGMLGGSFARDEGNHDRFVVTSFCADSQSHARYEAEVFPALYERAEPSHDLLSIMSYFVDLEAAWRVIP